MIAMGYLDDLTDEEMMQRPVAGSNHVKWQLGHLIASENQMIEGCFPGKMPSLPEGFASRYEKSAASCDDPSQFDDKNRLLEIYRQQREGTLAVLESVNPEVLGEETDASIRSYAPTVGAALIMQETHWMMHAGQWAVLRRKLGRAPLF
jgi:hypothetical protein